MSLENFSPDTNMLPILRLTVSEKGGIFVVPHPLRYEASVFLSHPKDRPV
jgi:hypothetical protein